MLKYFISKDVIMCNALIKLQNENWSDYIYAVNDCVWCNLQQAFYCCNKFAHACYTESYCTKNITNIFTPKILRAPIIRIHSSVKGQQAALQQAFSLADQSL